MNELFNLSGIRISAELIISLCAIFLTIYQAVLTRKHNWLSVRPHLVWDIRKTRFHTGIELCFVLQNKGIGPAIIKDRYFILDGDRFDSDKSDEVESLAKALIGNKFPFHLYRHGLPGRGVAIAPGGEIVVAHLIFNEQMQPYENQLNELMNRAAFKATYESLYREKFVL